MLDKLQPKLEQLFVRKIELEKQIAALETTKFSQNCTLFEELGKITKILDVHDALVHATKDQKELEADILEPALKELAASEIEKNQILKDKLEKKLGGLLLGDSESNVSSLMLELRAGAGGEEAGIFTKDLYRMYYRFCEQKGWACELIHSADMGLDSWRAAVLRISGQGCFEHLQSESGVHRVQRVPSTESKGRIQTSTVTVAVLPEPKEVQVSLGPGDYTKDTYVASGPGGQHRNRTESAVRLVHISTGISVDCADGKSQHQNLDRALKLLKARLYAHQQQKIHEERAANRKQQIGGGQRAEKIRTYNYQQNRVTDHRLNQNFPLNTIINGTLDNLFEQLKAHSLESKLNSME